MAPAKKRAKRARSPFRPAPARRATARQLVWLKALAELGAKLGKTPSAAELGEHMGTSRLGARRALKALEAHGLAKDVPRTISSGKWALTPAGISALAPDDD